MVLVLFFFFFLFAVYVLRSFYPLTLNLSTFQIPDARTGKDRVDAVVVDEESVGTITGPGCGGKILRGDGALECYLAETKSRDPAVFALYMCLLFMADYAYNILIAFHHFSGVSFPAGTC